MCDYITSMMDFMKFTIHSYISNCLSQLQQHELNSSYERRVLVELKSYECLQRALSCTVTAQPVGKGEVAVQVTHVSLAPCPIYVSRLDLDLQGGMHHSARSVAGMKPPFLITPKSSRSLLLLAEQRKPASHSRSSTNRASCLAMSCAVLKKDMAQVPAYVLCANGERSDVYDAVALPEKLLAKLLVAFDTTPACAGDGDGRVSSAAMSLESLTADMGNPAAVSTLMHVFRLELPSFTLVNSMLPAGETNQDRAFAFGAPVIQFIGPYSASAGESVLLMWKVGWPDGDAMAGHEAGGVC
jgi:hypothetical protein